MVNKIRLHQITLNNFRPFYGTQTIDLATEPEKPLVLIKALNDVGKTSMFRALQFCLYGGGNVISHINRTAASEEEGQTFVSIKFYHDDKHYQVTRRVNFSNESGVLTTGKEHLDVLVDGRPETLSSISDQRNYIETILPEDASQFFFFDGEDIQKYTLQPRGDNVRISIEMVLGIRELLNSRDDIQNVGSQLSSELTQLLKTNSKHAEEAKKIEQLGKEVNALKASIESLTGKIIQAEQTINNCDGTLRRNKTIAQKISERNEAEKQRNEIQENIENNKVRERDFNKHLGLILVSPVFHKLASIGRTNVPHWKKNAISFMLRGCYDHCLCKRPITPEVRQYFEDFEEREIEDAPLRYLSSQIDELLRHSPPDQLENEFYDLIEKRKEFEQNLLTVNLKIKELNEFIAGRDDLGLEFKTTEETRKKAAMDLDAFKKKKTGQEALLDHSSKSFSKRQEKLAKEQSDKDVENKQKLLSRCKRCEQAITESIEMLVASNREKVEELATEIFLQLTNAPDLYKGIDITDKYELMIKTVGGGTRPVWKQDPSSGQSQIIATSFLSALNRYTAREAPVIIDTPIGRLDTIHKENIINFYPKIAPQVVIFYQPNELNNNDLAPIERYISSEWILQRDAENPDTTLIRKLD